MGGVMVWDLSTAYNETDVRAEFVDPLFEALGWDVSNRAGQEVRMELQGNACSTK